MMQNKINVVSKGSGVIRAIEFDKDSARLFVSCYNLGIVEMYEAVKPLKIVRIFYKKIGFKLG